MYIDVGFNKIITTIHSYRASPHIVHIQPLVAVSPGVYYPTDIETQAK